MSIVLQLGHSTRMSTTNPKIEIRLYALYPISFERGDRACSRSEEIFDLNDILEKLCHSTTSLMTKR